MISSRTEIEKERNMSDNDLLLKISQLMDTKLQPMQAQIENVKNDLQAEIQRVETKLEAEIQRVETKLEAEIQRTNLTLENNAIPRLQNIESCYTSTYDRYRLETEKINALEMDVNILKRAMQEHIIRA